MSGVFQFTPLREGRQSAAGAGKKVVVFQFTPLREGRRYIAGQEDMSDAISIHAPPRGATYKAFVDKFKPKLFQFTPLREGRHESAPRALYRSCEFQFTPLREGRQDFFGVGGHFGVFQFTPLREGRHGRTRRGGSAFAFQFTPLREGRPQNYSKLYAAWKISIHAPPRGATVHGPET